MSIEIDIGSGRIDARGNTGEADYIDLRNPCNADGTIDTVSFNSGSGAPGVIVGTFYGSGTTYTMRAHAHLGNFSAGLKTVTGLSIEAKKDDFAGLGNKTWGVYFGRGGVGLPYAAYNTVWDGNAHTYKAQIGFCIDFYMTGTGETGGGGATSKTINIRLGNLYLQNIQVLSSTGWTKGKIN